MRIKTSVAKEGLVTVATQCHLWLQVSISLVIHGLSQYAGGGGGDAFPLSLPQDVSLFSTARKTCTVSVCLVLASVVMCWLICAVPTASAALSSFIIIIAPPAGSYMQRADATGTVLVPWAGQVPVLKLSLIHISEPTRPY